MIKLFGRMVPALVRGVRGPTIAPTAPLVSRFRVLPHDIDANRHLNNGRYLQMIDVNRVEWLLRTGILRTVLSQGWKPILGATTVQFRRELKLWDRAHVSTRLLGWETRWVYLEHRVDTPDGRPAAVALAKAGFRRRGGWVTMDQLLAALPDRVEPMPLPDFIGTWCALGDELGVDMGQRQLSAQSRDRVPSGLDAAA